MYEIENNIPLSTLKAAVITDDWPTSTMEIGDSFVFPIALRQIFYKHVNDYHDDKKFVARNIGDNNCRAWRIW